MTEESLTEFLAWNCGGFLGYERIKELITKHSMITNYFSLEQQLQPDGFDLTLNNIEVPTEIGEVSVLGKKIPKSISLQQRNLRTNEPIMANAWVLKPGSYIIVFNEIIHLPNNIAAISIQRSTLTRCNVGTNVGSWDAGYNGQGQNDMTVKNPFGFRVYKNARVVQMHFIPVIGKTKPYNGSYQNERLKE